MRSNGELFGIPESADKYELEKPKDWPADQKWDEDLETQARKIAHEEGLSGKALNRMVGLYADKVKGLLADADEQLAQANTKMMAELTKDWGGETRAKMTQAQQAAAAIAAKAGLSQEAVAGISMALKEKTGDAGVIRLFAAVGEMLGDDGMEALNNGGAGFSTTPAEARAELAKLRAPGGAYYEAVSKDDHRALSELKPKIERLSKIAAQ